MLSKITPITHPISKTKMHLTIQCSFQGAFKPKGTAYNSEAVSSSYSAKKVFLEISENLQGNTCARTASGET